MMFLKLCLILGLLALVAIALTRLFPARQGEPRERSFNELMAEVDLDQLQAAADAEAAEAAAADVDDVDGDAVDDTDRS